MKMDGLTVMKRLTLSKEQRLMRSYICRWRDVCLKKESQQDFIFSIMQKKKKMGLRKAFIMWLAHSKRQTLEDRYDTMSELITKMWYKQKVFLSMKHAVMNS